MKEQIKNLIDNFKGKASVVVKNLKTNETVAFNENELFPIASIIKINIIIELFRQSENNEIDINKEINIFDYEKEFVLNMGVIHLLNKGLKLTYYDLAVLTMVHSDNVATNILIDAVGMDKINATAKSLGFVHTMFNRKMQAGPAHSTTGNELVLMFELVLNTNLISKESRDAILSMLYQQRWNTKLPWYFISNVRSGKVGFAHKTGEIVGAESDAGILFYNDNKYIITVLTKDLENNIDGIVFIQEVGKIIYNSVVK